MDRYGRRAEVIKSRRGRSRCGIRRRSPEHGLSRAPNADGAPNTASEIVTGFPNALVVFVREPPAPLDRPSTELTFWFEVIRSSVAQPKANGCSADAEHASQLPPVVLPAVMFVEAGVDPPREKAESPELANALNALVAGLIIEDAPLIAWPKAVG